MVKIITQKVIELKSKNVVKFNVHIAKTHFLMLGHIYIKAPHGRTSLRLPHLIINSMQAPYALSYLQITSLNCYLSEMVSLPN